MLIDWFTLIAQLVNFLILVWLLKRFLYKPILKIVDEREKRIVTQLQDAEALKNKATIELNNYELKNQEFEQQRQELFNTTVSEVDALRQKLLEQARTDIEKLREQLKTALKNEQQNLGSEIKERVRSEVFLIVRKTLKDLSSVKLEGQMIEVFIKKLKDLGPKEKELLLSAITKNKGEVVVRSTFGFSQSQKSEIESFIRKELFFESDEKFETAPQLVSGIELIAGGYKIGWSIDNYIDSLERHINELIVTKAL